MIYYGYARISRPTQDIQRQKRNISALYPESVIVEEAYTGTKLDRPKWSMLYKTIIDKANKNEKVTVIFDSVSRMSRNAEEGFTLYQELYNLGINLVFLNEPHINTSVYKESASKSIAKTGNEIADIYIEATNKALMLLLENQIRIAFDQAQKEIDDLHKRTKQGIETARLKGKQIGQKKGAKLKVKNEAPIKDIIKEYSFELGLKDSDVMVIINDRIYKNKINFKGEQRKISTTTYYRYKRELRNREV